MSPVAIYHSHSPMDMELDHINSQAVGWTDFDFESARQDSYSSQSSISSHYPQSRYISLHEHFMHDQDAGLFPIEMTYHHTQYLHPSPSSHLSYHGQHSGYVSPSSTIPFFSDHEDAESMVSSSRTYSLGHNDPHSPITCQPYYNTIPSSWNAAGDLTSMPAPTSQISHMGSHFVVPAQIEQTSPSHDLSGSEPDGEGEPDPDSMPVDIPAIRLSSHEQTPELENGITEPSTEDEAHSDPNDSEYSPSGRKRRRSSQTKRAVLSPATVTRSGRHSRKPSASAITNQDSADLTAAPIKRVAKSSGPRVKRNQSAIPGHRPFYCPLTPYGCSSTFPSKNEWKRHVSTQHVKRGFWRCELCPPQTGGGQTAGSYNDFNRKDLFTQHLKRMHADELAEHPHLKELLKTKSESEINMIEAIDRHEVKYMVAQTVIDYLVTNNFTILRELPTSCRCPICDQSTFRGQNAWEARLEHMAGHFERNKRSGKLGLAPGSWKDDRELSVWLIQEGLVEQLTDGKWRLGDGRPLRDN